MLEQMTDAEFRKAYRKARNAWADHWCDRAIGVRCHRCGALDARYQAMKAEKARREQQQHGGESGE